jgi:transcription elongation factor GreB
MARRKGSRGRAFGPMPEGLCVGRYRPAEPRGSAYITPEGFDKLKREFDQLWRTRAEVTAALAAAAAEGDRSENAEYIYRKKQLREIDRRVRYLQKRLDELNVVSGTPADATRVYFGAWVRLEDDAGEVVTYRIVGPDEFDVNAGYISLDSPLGRALLKKGLDEEVLVRRPDGEKCYYVMAISYGRPPPVD